MGYFDIVKAFMGHDKIRKGSIYYDVETKEIINAKKYSLSWWHEYGHNEYSKTDKCMDNDFSRQTMWKMSVFFIMITLFAPIFKYFALTFMLSNIWYAVYEEWWAWNYGYKKWTEQESNKGNKE